MSSVSGSLALVSVKGFASSLPRAEGGEPLLDPAQRAVVALADGASAAVIGAPGSGKTTTLVALVEDRIARRGWSANELMVIAPSRVSASRLRDQLAVRLEVPTEGPLARTVNSLAFDIVRNARAAAGLEPPRLLTGGDQDTDIAQLLAGHVEDGTGPMWPDPLSEQVRSLKGFRTELRDFMMRATEYGVDQERLRHLAAVQDHPEWAAVADFRAEYLQVVSVLRPNQLDSAELVSAACTAVNSGVVPESVERLRLVVVDDIQEATRSTVNLLTALAARGISVIAFGDPDVAAGGFRGAEPLVLGSLGAVLGIDELSVHLLDTSHRQGESLRRLTTSVTDRIGRAATRVHNASALPDDTSRIVTLTAQTPAREWTAISRRLREAHLVDDIPWNSMCVIVRSGGLVPTLARALSLADVPTRMAVGGTPLRDDIAASGLLRVVDVGMGRTPLNAELATELLSGQFCGLDRVELRRLRLALRAEELAGGGTRNADALLVEALSQPGRLATIDHRVARRAQHLADTLGEVRRLAASGGTIEELLWLIWERSGLADSWRAQALGAGILAAEANRNLDGVLALFTAAKRFVERDPDSPATLFLDQVLDADVPEDSLAPQAAADAVLVTTPAGVVGLEFDTVAVAGLQEGIWPNRRLRGSLLNAGALLRVLGGLDGAQLDDRKEVLDDELRMFALAVSRARRQVILASVDSEDEAQSVFLSLVPEGADAVQAEVLPALNLRGLVGRLRRELNAGRAGADDAASALALLAEREVPGASPDEWHGLLDVSTDRELFLEDEPVRLSPSKLKTLEDSALDWFVDTYSGGESSLSMSIGTIVHAAMENTRDSSLESLLEVIESRWGELDFEAPWIAEQQWRAVRRLAAGISEYLGDFEREGKVLVGAERRFELELGRAQIAGSIDRVELDRDGAVVIVDLKTGRAITKPDELREHAQLSAYQLAYAEGKLDEQLAHLGEHHAGGAKLLFVKEGLRKKLYRDGVQAPMTDEELEAFREVIRQAIRTVTSTTFAGTRLLDPFGFGDASRQALHRVRAVSHD